MKQRIILWIAAQILSVSAWAEEVQVAVATNFAAPMKVIAGAFEQSSGHHVALAFGATGKFYAQIKNGAPFEVFLAADDQTPAKLVAEGLALPASRITYAVGRLALWSLQEGVVDDQGDVLRSGQFDHLALAAPKLAPYGAAAMATLSALGVLDRWQDKLVQGENIAQTQQFIRSGNAPLGFVALSQIMEQGRLKEGSSWLVPAHLHPPLMQDGVVLVKGQNNAAAWALINYLQSAEAQRIVQSYGYQLAGEKAGAPLP